MSSPTPRSKAPVKTVVKTPTLVLPTESSILAQRPKDHIMMFYGPPGVGKTSFVNSLAPRVLFISTDRGTRSLNALRVEVTTFDEIIATIEAIEKLPTCPYDIVCIDHIDDMCRMVGEVVCDGLEIDALGDAGFGKGWKLYSDGIFEVIAKLKRLKIGIAFICHETIKTIRAHGIETERTMPDMSKSAWKLIIPLVDLVGFCGFTRVKTTDGKMVEARTLRTQPSEGIYAKDRTRRSAPKGIEMLDGPKFIGTFSTSTKG